jgi:uncharacterized protein YwgA
MRESLVALDLVLDELGVPTKVDTFRDRKLVQKAVYVAKAAGVDLGYAYGWYVHGPYSPALTRDYFALDEARETEPPPKHATLQKQVKDALAKGRDLLTVPKDVDLSPAEWAELIASLLFLYEERRLSANEARDEIVRLKKPLAAYVDRARQALIATGLAEGPPNS